MLGFIPQCGERPVLCLSSSSQRGRRKLKSWFPESKQRAHLSPGDGWGQLDYDTFYQEENRSRKSGETGPTKEKNTH